MTIFSHIYILTLDELSQLCSRKRAIVVLGLYLLMIGLVIWGFSAVDQSLSTYFTQHNMPRVRSDEALQKFGELTGQPLMKRIVNWPIPFPLFQFFAILWISELIAMVSCDMLSRDRERGTLRFLFLRTSRSALYTAKFFSHLLLYVLVHCCSLLVLAGVLALRSQELSFAECLQPIAAYSWSLVPFMVLALSMTLFASALSRSIIGALFKVHFLWIPVFILWSYGIFSWFSWQTLAGIVVPFGEFAVANIVGNLSLGALFFLLGFFFFRRAEV